MEVKNFSEIYEKINDESYMSEFRGITDRKICYIRNISENLKEKFTSVSELYNIIFDYLNKKANFEFIEANFKIITKEEKDRSIESYIKDKWDREKQNIEANIKSQEKVQQEINSYTRRYINVAKSNKFFGTVKSVKDSVIEIIPIINKHCQEKKIQLKDFELIYNIEANDEINKDNFKGEEYIDMQETIKELILKGGIHQIILTGAPGTGKTYMAKKIAEELGSQFSFKIDDNGNPIKNNDNKVDLYGKNYKIVQFHPSYDYTDFVEGIRPINENNKMIFKKFDGVFKAFCRNVATLNQANENKKNLYFFIIDEINRADLSKVLGELMLGLEKDKREEPIETQYSNIKTYYDTNENKDINEEEDDRVFKNGFFIPENIVIIGTMNDIDRSVESMDFALRRRFTWIEVEVDEKGESLKQAFKNKLKFCGHIEDEKDREMIIKRIVNLNKIIKDKGAEYNLNKHYFISQGYFTNIPNIEETKDVKGLLDWVWKYRIKSLIEEYVRAENSETIDTFIEECEKAFLIDGE